MLIVSNTATLAKRLFVYFRREYRRWQRQTFRSRADSGKTLYQTQQTPPLPITPDVFIASLLLLFALCVRLFRISHPNTVVFDELHFGRFVKRYRDGEYFFDIHPPLAKLVLFVVSKLFANEPNLDYKNVGVPYGPTIYVPLRVTNAIFGAVVSPVVFLICREIDCSFFTSLVPAFMQAVDMLVVIESRMILLEGQLLFYMALSLYCALKLWNAKKRTRQRYLWLVATAVAGSCALSTKWTSLATPGLIAIISITGWVFPKEGPLEIFEMVIAGVIAIIWYMTLFRIHFWLLPNSGDGDAFMLAPFQRTLIGNKKYYDPDAKPPSFLSTFIWLNGEMFRANRRIKTKHPYQSPWYTWILNYRGLLFHYRTLPKSQGLIERMYLIVNPVVSIANLLAILYFLLVHLLPFIATRLKRRRKEKTEHPYPTPKTSPKSHLKQGAFFLAGYILNLLPYVEVSRCTFIYHFIPALFYNQLLLANVLDAMEMKRRRVVCVGIVAATVLAYGWWAPWIYATGLTEAGHGRRRLWGMKWR